MKNKILISFICILFFNTIGTSVFDYSFPNISKISRKADNKKESFIKINQALIQTISEKISKHYLNLFKHRVFNGCVLVAIDGNIIYENAFGYSDIHQKAPLTTNNIFQLASVSKIFTATAIMKLYEQGKLDINQTLQYYFPQFPYNTITIKQLLNHTSGLPNYLNLMKDVVRQDTTLSSQSVLDFFAAHKYKLEYKPGRRYHYCNTNYVLLACLVEKISGSSFSDFLKKEIFTPAEMPHTNTIQYVDMFDKNTTTSSEYKKRYMPLYACDFILGDKSIYSSTHDLLNFSKNLMDGKILSPTTLQMMTEGVPTKRYGMYYGFGLRIRDAKDSAKMIIFHNGWWHGYRTAFQMRPKDRVTVIVLSNHIHKTAYYTYPVFQAIDEVLYNNKTEINSNQEIYPTLGDE